jgi:hypothetical protein
VLKKQALTRPGVGPQVLYKLQVFRHELWTIMGLRADFSSMMLVLRSVFLRIYFSPGIIGAKGGL